MVPLLSFYRAGLFVSTSSCHTFSASQVCSMCQLALACRACTVLSCYDGPWGHLLVYRSVLCTCVTSTSLCLNGSDFFFFSTCSATSWYGGACAAGLVICAAASCYLFFYRSLMILGARHSICRIWCSCRLPSTVQPLSFIRAP